MAEVKFTASELCFEFAVVNLEQMWSLGPSFCFVLSVFRVAQRKCHFELRDFTHITLRRGKSGPDVLCVVSVFSRQAFFRGKRF